MYVEGRGHSLSWHLSEADHAIPQVGPSPGREYDLEATKQDAGDPVNYAQHKTNFPQT